MWEKPLGRWDKIEGGDMDKVVAEAWEAQMQKQDLKPESKECSRWEKWRNEMSRKHREKDAEQARGGSKCELGT